MIYNLIIMTMMIMIINMIMMMIMISFCQYFAAPLPNVMFDGRAHAGERDLGYATRI